MAKKDLREYIEKYGEVPKDFQERLLHLLQKIKFSDKDINKLQSSIRKLIKPKWEEMDFVFYFVPKATPRARYSGRTRAFYVKDASDNSRLFKEFIDSCENDYGVITTPCKLYMDMYLPIPSSMNKVEKILAELKLIWAISKPDWDNAGKTYCDMIQKHLLLEDCLVIDGRVRKFYSSKPRIEIHIEWMEKFDCKFNKKKVENWKFYKDAGEKVQSKDSIV